jgi:spermidine/putrescine transport system substrate-binding protein
MLGNSRFHDDLLSGKLTRRQAGKALAAAGVVSLAVPVISRPATAECVGADLTFFTWGGYDDPNFVGAYVEQYGCEPSYSLLASEPEAMSKMTAGFEPQVIYPCSGVIKRWKDAGLIVPVDVSLLKNWPDVLPAAKDIPGTMFDGERYFVPEDFGQTSVLFRSDLAPEYVDNHTWGILYDETYKGRLGTTSLWSDNVLPAAMYLGFDPFDMTDEQVMQVGEALRNQRDLMRYYADSTTDLSQALFSGEVVASTAINSMWMRAMDQMDEPDFDGQYVWMEPKEGTLNWVCGLVIHPSARRDGLWEMAHDMIDAMISVDSQYYELTEWHYGVVNSKVYEMVDDEFLARIGLTRDINGYLQSGVFLQHTDREPELVNMWDAVMSDF